MSKLGPYSDYTVVGILSTDRRYGVGMSLIYARRRRRLGLPCQVLTRLLATASPFSSPDHYFTLPAASSLTVNPMLLHPLFLLLILVDLFKMHLKAACFRYAWTC